MKTFFHAEDGCAVQSAKSKLQSHYRRNNPEDKRAISILDAMTAQNLTIFHHSVFVGMFVIRLSIRFRQPFSSFSLSP
jgi:hypothetical protein